MVFSTTKRMIDDLLAGISAVQKQHSGKEIVLVGHSGGGGLIQYIVSRSKVWRFLVHFQVQACKHFAIVKDSILNLTIESKFS